MRNSQQRAFVNLTLGIILTSVILIGCSKDFFYLPASPQEEMEKAVEGGFDDMIVYINQSGKSSYYSAGFNNREKQIPDDPYDLFKIASISKLYIAAAKTKLVASGQLDQSNHLIEISLV
jgi:hypothetical protein